MGLVLLTASLASLISAILFVIVATEHPFTGDISGRPEPFEHVLSESGGA